jgi:hypothetical protein
VENVNTFHLFRLTLYTIAMLTLVDVEAQVQPLQLPIGHYVLFGSLPLLAHGLIQGVNDIDILVDARGWNYANTLGQISLSPKGHQVIDLGEVEIYAEWLDMDVESVIAKATLINSLPYATLEDVLFYKNVLNRPKDQDHIQRIETFLQTA